MSERRRLFKNSVANLFGWLFPAVVVFVSTPFISRHLGDEKYGILGILSILIGYFNVLDLGLGSAAIRSLAEANAGGDLPRMNKIIRLNIFFFIAVGVIGEVLLIVFSQTSFVSVFKIGQPPLPPDAAMQLQSEAKTALIIAGISFGINALTGVMGSVPRALQKFGVANLIVAVTSLLNTVGLILILLNGNSLVTIVIFQLGINLAALVANAIYAKRLVGGLSLLPKFDRAVFKEQFGFGGFLFLNALASIFVFQADRTFLAIWLGPAELPYFLIPSMLALRIQAVMAKLAEALFPLASVYTAEGQLDKLKTIYIKATEYTSLIGGILTLVVAGMSRQILTLWMGAAFAEKSSLILCCLAISAFLESYSASPYYIVNGMNKPKFNAKWGMISGVVHIATSLIFIYFFGLVGAGIGSLVAHAYLPFLYMSLEKNILEIPTSQSPLWRIQGVTVALVVGLVIVMYQAGTTFSAGATLLIGSPVAVAVFVLVILGLNIFPRDEANALVKKISLKLGF